MQVHRNRKSVFIPYGVHDDSSKVILCALQLVYIGCFSPVKYSIRTVQAQMYEFASDLATSSVDEDLMW
jgi:hypothetical protein